MPSRVPVWARPGRSPVAEPFTWVTLVMRLVGLMAGAVLWWALAFLPWKRAGSAVTSPSWLPTLPVQLTDLEVAVFGPLGASLVVVALLRRARLASVAVILGFLVSASLTLIRGATSFADVLNGTERVMMLGVSAGAALAGLAAGVVAIGSLRRFGFLGLLAVSPVVSLSSVVLAGSGVDPRWLTRSAMVALLVMIAWDRWSGVLLWPVLFALFWLLGLAMTALGHGAQTLRHGIGSNASVKVATEAMLDFARSAWRAFLETTWDLFWWPVLIAAVVIAAWNVWRRISASGG